MASGYAGGHGMADQTNAKRDHGGGLDAAIARYGGARAGWIDLSTGINPVPYPLPDLPSDAWTALPDAGAFAALEASARAFWNVPDAAGVVIAHGASAPIARLPALWPTGRVHIPAPTYNEHAAAFAAHGWAETETDPDVRVLVHPNNPTGDWADPDQLAAPALIIDESFADVDPARSLIAQAAGDNTVILKSFGKFWGLAGLRLGFAIGPRALTDRLNTLLGPWSVSGPALHIATQALSDTDWAGQTRVRLQADVGRLDALMTRAGATVAGGTPLFRLYDVGEATAWQDRLARAHIWSRIFPYSDRWLRLGLPGPDDWDRVGAAL